MLEDFIEANGLKARIVPRALKADLIKCRFFVAGSDEILAISLNESPLSFEKISATLGKEAAPVSDARAEQMTGYQKQFMPPVSIYGVKVLLDKRVLEKQLVHCLVGEERTLGISPGEIKDFNDDVMVVDITR
jgi:prolyl-tRNA editing enzyme YbaK/EbsC (Cys-tRNA(Pro) deacylase)